MHRFRNGERVIVIARHHPCKGKTGTVVRLRRADEAAWINMDDPLPGDLASFPTGDERRNHMFFYPDECEPEPRAQRPPTTINRLPALDGKIVEVLGTLEPEHDTARQAPPAEPEEEFIYVPRHIAEALGYEPIPPIESILKCPYCGFAQPSPFEKVGLYICGNCDRTVEVKE